MTAESPEAVLDDGDDGPLMAGSLTLVVAFALTVWVVVSGGAIEAVLLAAVLWSVGALLRVAEVTQA